MPLEVTHGLAGVERIYRRTDEQLGTVPPGQTVYIAWCVCGLGFACTDGAAGALDELGHHVLHPEEVLQ